MAAKTMTVTLDRIDGLSFAARANTGHWTVMDAPREMGGNGGASSPLELVLMGLAGCTAIDVVDMLRKMRARLSGFWIDAEAERAEEQPSVFTKIKLRYRLRGRVTPAQVARAIKLSHETYCAVAAMLQPTVAIEHEYEIEYEATPDSPEA